MSVEVIYRVRKTNGELAGEYMDKKLADAHDQKLDCIYLIADLIREQAQDLEEAKIEAIAEHLLTNKQVLLNALKKVKDIPDEAATPADSKTTSKTTSNITSLESDAAASDNQNSDITKKVANS